MFTPSTFTIVVTLFIVSTPSASLIFSFLLLSYRMHDHFEPYCIRSLTCVKVYSPLKFYTRSLLILFLRVYALDTTTFINFILRVIIIFIIS